ncbi:MAG: hypothetical protein LLF96_13850 [Eubacteriales bacterium]|nr:hypothetical protein [Eubacteriales bacterium]
MAVLGKFMGTLTGLLFFLALLNYPVKWINKRWIHNLPKTSRVKSVYTSIMKTLVQKHRFFAFGAVITLAIHLYLQITYRWLSVTGIITGGLLVVTVLLGSNLFFRHKGTRGLLFKTHRIAAFTVLLSLIIHEVTKMI